MIVFNLGCENKHLFEGWFASAGAFEDQQQRGLVTCPICGSLHIERRPSAPYVNTRSSTPESPSSSAETPQQQNSAQEKMKALFSMLRHIGRTSEDVGKEFADEARRIHQGKSEARNIRGQASSTDVDELLDEGILVLPLLPEDGDLH